MTTDHLLRESLDKLASSVQTTPPPLEDLLTRSDTRAPIRPPRSSRLLVTASVAIALLLAGGVAGAVTGVIPEIIRGIFGQTDQTGLRASIEDAELHRTFTSGDGTVYELWIAPTDGGGSCTTVIRSTGAPGNDFISCGNLAFGTLVTAFVNVGGFNLGNQTALYGSAPDDAEQVAITFTDGSTFEVPVTDNEFFIVIDKTCTTAQVCDVSTAEVVAEG